MAMALRQERGPIRVHGSGGRAPLDRHADSPASRIRHHCSINPERSTGAVNMLVDISERKRAEADLAERQAQLAVFVEHAPAAIAMFDRETALPRRLGGASLSITVSRRANSSSAGRTTKSFPTSRSVGATSIPGVLAGEELSHDEDTFPRADGGAYWVRWLIDTLAQGQRKSSAARFCSPRRRTEQVEARRALAESEARFRAAFENAAVGVVLVDPKGSLLRVNRQPWPACSVIPPRNSSRRPSKTLHTRTILQPISPALEKTHLLAQPTATSSRSATNSARMAGHHLAGLTVGCVRRRWTVPRRLFPLRNRGHYRPQVGGGSVVLAAATHNSISRARSRASAASCTITAQGNRSCHQVVRPFMGCPRARLRFRAKSGAGECIRTISSSWTPSFAAPSPIAKENASWNFGYSATVRCGG